MVVLSFPSQMGVCLAVDQRLAASNPSCAFDTKITADTTVLLEKPAMEEKEICNFFPKVLCIGNLRHVAPYFLQKELLVGKLAKGKTIGQALGMSTIPTTSNDNSNSNSNRNSSIVKNVALVDWWPKELVAGRLALINTGNQQQQDHNREIHNNAIATPEHMIQKGDVLRGRLHFHEQSVLEKPRPTIVYNDKNYIVVNKPGGIDVLSNPSSGRVVNSLPGIIMEFLNDSTEPATSISSPNTIIPAHRIDNPVSGLVCCGKTNKDAKRLSRKIQSRETIKTVAIMPWNY